MRMMLTWSMDTEAGNEAIRNGKIAEVNQSIMERLRPEAAYFRAENGRRTAYIVFDMADVSQIPVIAEPLFQHLNASVEFCPVMNAEDLQKGLAEVARDFGS